MKKTRETSTSTGLEIAIIGMSCRFPQAKNIHEFWDNLKNARECISFFSDEELRGTGIDPDFLQDPAYKKAKGTAAHARDFDAVFFGYTPKEAEVMDPQVRIFHECAWEALEDAGYDPGSYKKLIGCYAGASPNFYWEALSYMSGNTRLLGNFTAGQLNDKDFLSTRLGHKLDLKGPCVTVQTACSTSLVALHLACQGLLIGECDMALAGGITITFPEQSGYFYRESMIASADGHCRAFDANSQGTIYGNGIGIVLLKRLEDALADEDHIYAVIKGSSINNDGTAKAGYTAPSIEGQARVIRAAMRVAEVEPASISYIETHGTGTVLGDPVEIEGLKMAFNTQKKNFCALGSVKTNIGHTDHASGVAGVIKTTLALKHRLIPPSLHFETPNPKIDFNNSPFYVNTQLKEWENSKYPLRAGVSSFGIGGTNAHMILEEAPARLWDNEGTRGLAPLFNAETSPKSQLIILSAKNQTSLDKVTDNFVQYLKQNPQVNLADAAYTLQVGRKPLEHRKMAVCSSVNEAVETLTNPESEKTTTFFFEGKERPIIFMFPGQGSQYVNMGRDLYKTEPLFRQEMDRCFEILNTLVDYNLKEILYPGISAGKQGPPLSTNFSSSNRSDRSDIPHINQTEIAQPLLFAVEYALSKLLMQWGIHPYAMIGHSIGEYAAAHLSGVLSLEGALTLVAARGKLMQEISPGSMLSIPLPEESIIPMLSEEISLAAVNSSAMCVVSGPHQAIAALERQLKQESVKSRVLTTSHAFHSGMMDPLLKDFEAVAAKVALKKPKIPFISDITGDWLRPEQASDPCYWALHIRRPVRFAKGLQQLFQREHALFLEVGPGKALSAFVRQHHGKQPHHLVLNLVRHPREEVSDNDYLLTRIGRLWTFGGSVDRKALHSSGSEKRLRIPLPTYPFESRTFSITAPAAAAVNTMIAAGPGTDLNKKRKKMDDWFYVPSWKRSDIPHANPINTKQTNWLVFLDEPGIGSTLVERIEKENPRVLITLVKIGERFGYPDAGSRRVTLNPAAPGDYDLLLKELIRGKRLPGKILHLWNVVNRDKKQEPLMDRLNAALEQGFYSLLYLSQAIGRYSPDQAMEIMVFSNNMQDVSGYDLLFPERSTLLGPVMIIPREYENITCRSIDVVLADQKNTLAPPDTNRLIKQLSGEIFSKHSEAVVAYRDCHRWVRNFEPVLLETYNHEKLHPRLKPGGVYLITGGLGGIGLSLAKRLAEIKGVKLILTGRTAFPAKKEWDRALENDIGDKVQELKKLEAQGAELLVLQADVSNEAQMRQAVEKIKKQFKTINGVIHAAGLPSGGLIQLKTREMAEEIMAAKVKGTLVLDRVLAGECLDFMVLCSSINSVVPMVGQVDYTAANVFLDAFAAYKTARDSYFTASINWDPWQELGMAARTWNTPTTSAGNRTPKGTAVDHPLLDRYIPAEGETREEIYITRLSFKQHWVLNEHRTEEKGVLAGTTYIEMVRAAFKKHSGDRPIEIRDLYFLYPLMVEENQEKEVRLILKKSEQKGEDQVFAFQVKSPLPFKPGDNKEGDRWREHARGTVAILEIPGEAAPKQLEIKEIKKSLHREKIVGTGKEKEKRIGLIRFGPRWLGLRRVNHSEDQGLAFLELPPEYEADFVPYRLHPALLDAATGFLYGLLGVGSIYMPFSYGRIRIKGSLPRKILSYSRLIEDKHQNGNTPGDFLRFNITIMNEQGVELLDIAEFTMLKFSDEVLSRINEKSHQSRLDPAPPTPAAAKPVDSAGPGILPEEGVMVFDRVLAAQLPQVVVSTTDLLAKTRAALDLKSAVSANKSLKNRAPVSGYSRPQLSTPYAAPKNKTQEKLAAVWEEFLGIKPVGSKDDFFELGGDSLKAIVLGGRIHRELNVEVPLTLFFNSPTVEGLAEYINSTEESQFHAITPAPEMEYYPLSSSQLRLYILQQIDPRSTAYNLPEVFELEGKIDRARLEQTFRQLLKRHESLRTSFEIVEGKPVQKVHPFDNAAFAIQYHLLTPTHTGGTRGDLPTDNRQQVTSTIKNFIRPFDLKKPPLFRIGLVQWSQSQNQLLMMDFHHTIYDGTSKGILLKEFLPLYSGKTLPELKLQYKDFAWWQQHHKQDESIKKQEKFWLKEFAGDVPVLNLPYDYPRPAVQSFAGSHVTFYLNLEELNALKALALKAEATFFMVLLAILNILLSKLSSQEDIIVGTPVAGRGHADLERIFGLFINSLALRNHPQSEKSFMAFLKELREHTLKTFENQDYPFEDLIEKVELERDISRNPMFDVMLVLHNWVERPLHSPVTSASPKKDLRLKSFNSENPSSQFDMTFEGFETTKNFDFTVRYSTKLFKKETINRFIVYFKKIVSEVLRDPGLEIAGIEILSSEEKKQLLLDFNDTQVSYTADRTLEQIFREQAARTPDQVALVGQISNQEVPFGPINACGETGLRAKSQELIAVTYKELNRKSNQLAYVLKEKGVQPDTIVGIMTERSLEMILGIFAILKAGGAYLPIEPDYPQERIQYMLNDSGAKILLSADHHPDLPSSQLPSFTHLPIFPSSQLPSSHLSPAPAPVNSLAYIIYTSGSTGKPKGVMVEQRSVVNILEAVHRHFPLKGTDAYLLKTSYVFDVSVIELFGWFLEGGRLVILEKKAEKDPEKIIATIEKQGVTHINFVPSMFKVFMKVLTSRDIPRFSGLKYIFFAGEALLPEHVNKFTGLSISIILENIYGPTEGTVYSSRYPLSQWDGVSGIPIGKPLANVRLYILDKNNYLQPIGVPGELCIGGDGLSRGYLNNPELTAEKFYRFCRSHRFNRSYRSYMSYISKKIYNTGDLARWLTDGNIEFLGRGDQQLKIRGFRVELGEIQSVLLRHRSVIDAVIVARGDRDHGKYLCAYIVVEGELNTSRLNTYLGAALPDYMVPASYIRLGKIPLTPSGKIDYKKLPETGAVLETGIEYAAPGTEMEKLIASIWQQVLHLDRVGVNHNFFSLGGNSLEIIEVNHRLKVTLGQDIPMVNMFRYTTVVDFARYLQQGEGEEAHRQKDRQPILKRGKQEQMQHSQKRRRIRNEL